MAVDSGQAALKKISPSRIAAYKALSETLFSGSRSNAAISRHTASIQFESDAKLAAQIVYGTIKKKNKLEKIAKSLSNSNTPVDDRALLSIVMGIYQLLYLDRIPDYAVVNDSVNIVKAFVSHSLAPYTNALLRNVSKQKALFREPEKQFESRMLYDYGVGKDALRVLRYSMDDNEAESWAKRCQELPTLYIRVNTLKVKQQALIDKLENLGISAETTYVPGCLKIKEAKNIFKTDPFRKGEFFVQDLSSQIAIYALNPQKGDKIIDVCSAPGSKSFGAYIASSGNASITSADINAKKLDTLFRFSKQLSIPLRTVRRDAQKRFLEEEGQYDRAICDVPCSGLGVVSRKPEILSLFSLEKQSSLVDLQLSILEQSFRYIKKGGRVLYSTCTLAKAENDEVCAAFVQKEPSARLVPIELPFKLNALHQETKKGTLFLNNENDNCDGFFMCLIEKAY